MEWTFIWDTLYIVNVKVMLCTGWIRNITK